MVVLNALVRRHQMTPNQTIHFLYKYRNPKTFSRISTAGAVLHGMPAGEDLYPIQLSGKHHEYKWMRTNLRPWKGRRG